MENLLTLHECARLMVGQSLSTETLQQYSKRKKSFHSRIIRAVNQGKVKGLQNENSTWLIDRDSLLEWRNSQDNIGRYTLYLNRHTVQKVRDMFGREDMLSTVVQSLIEEKYG